MPNRRGHDHIGNFNFKVEVEGVTQGHAAEMQNFSVTILPQAKTDLVVSDQSGNYVLSGIGSDTLSLEGKLSPADIWFSRDGDDLVISINGTKQSLVVAQWFVDEQSMIETIVAGSYRLDGEKLTETLTLQADAELVVPDLWYQAF